MEGELVIEARRLCSWALFAYVLTTSVPAARAGGKVVFTYEEGTDSIALTAPSTIDGILHGQNTVRSCRYDAGAQGQDLLQAFFGADVQTAMHSHAVLTGEAGWLRAGSDTIEWQPKTPTAGSYSVRLLHLQLRVEMLKARVRCPV